MTKTEAMKLYGIIIILKRFLASRTAMLYRDPMIRPMCTVSNVLIVEGRVSSQKPYIESMKGYQRPYKTRLQRSKM